VNDEDFARAAFRHAMESGFAGEPAGLPNLDGISARARRTARTKQGVYAGSAVALAGVVTAGVVAGPSVLGLGGGSPQLSSAGQAGNTTPGATSGSKDAKAKIATPCPTPPQIDWASIITTAVPGSTATAVPKATAPDGNTCYLVAGGAMNIQMLFNVSNPKGVVEIDVNTGGDKAGQESPAAGASAAIASKLAAEASRSAVVASRSAARSTESPNAADLAKMEALKSQMAAQQSVTKSPANTFVKVAQPTPTCTGSKETQMVCATEVQKGGYVGISVSLTRGSSHPLFVQVVGSTSTPAPGQHAPLSSAQLTAIAKAVATHF
jgi:hypothetical protein